LEYGHLTYDRRSPVAGGFCEHNFIWVVAMPNNYRDCRHILADNNRYFFGICSFPEANNDRTTSEQIPNNDRTNEPNHPFFTFRVIAGDYLMNSDSLLRPNIR